MSTVKADNFTWRNGEATAQVSPTITGEQLVRGVAKSWVNFNGTGTIATRASFNVSSLTDNGTGDYTVNFTNSLVDANYSFSSSSGQNASIGPVPVGPQSATAPTSSALRIESGTFSTNTRADNSYIQVTVFR